jgi:hypothetical protein
MDEEPQVIEGYADPTGYGEGNWASPIQRCVDCHHYWLNHRDSGCIVPGCHCTEPFPVGSQEPRKSDVPEARQHLSRELPQRRPFIMNSLTPLGNLLLGACLGVLAAGLMLLALGVGQR